MRALALRHCPGVRRAGAGRRGRAGRCRRAAALRREIEQLQKQLQSVTERLQRLEAQPPRRRRHRRPLPSRRRGRPPRRRPRPAQPGISAMDLAPPRSRSLSTSSAAPGQLLFDIGIAGDFVGNLTQRNVEKAQGGHLLGTGEPVLPARDRALASSVRSTPTPRGRPHRGGRGRARRQRSTVTLAEAYLTLLTLPCGTQAQDRPDAQSLRLLNEIHEHDLPWVDRPNVMRNFFGSEGLAEQGVEVTFVPDLPFYVEALAGIFNGDNETAFGRGPLRDPARHRPASARSSSSATSTRCSSACRSRAGQTADQSAHARSSAGKGATSTARTAGCTRC